MTHKRDIKRDTGSHMSPDDISRLKACYGQMRLTARQWSAARGPDWSAIDECLVVVALMSALPECSDEDWQAMTEMLQAEPAPR